MFTVDQIYDLHDYALGKFEESRIAYHTAVEIANETGVNTSISRYEERMMKYKSWTNAAYKVSNYMTTVNSLSRPSPFRVAEPANPLDDPEIKNAVDALNAERLSHY